MLSRSDARAADRDGCSDIPLITGTNNYVPNSRLSASSSLDEMISGPARSRLNQRASGNLYGAWVPVTNNENQWIQVRGHSGRRALTNRISGYR